MTPAEAMRRFGDALDEAIRSSEAELVRALAARHLHVASIAWTRRSGSIDVEFELYDGRPVIGHGGGKLDALADAERQIAEMLPPE